MLNNFKGAARKSILGLVLASVAALGLSAAAPAEASRRPYLLNLVEEAVSEHASNSTFSVPAAGSIEVAFSPNEGSEALVLKVIKSAQPGSTIQMLSYSFTSAPVTRELLSAVHRGVKLQLVADYKNNVSEDRSGKARAALSALTNAGADVRTISVYAIHHDKVIIAGDTVELGSFNYSDAAAHKNSENVFVNWNNPALAKVYRGHFERNYRQSQPYRVGY